MVSVEEKPLQATADELAAIAEVLRGNSHAFRLIVERYKAVVFRLALSYLGSREEAEEAAQEIFFRAFKSLHRFSLDKRLLPWLYSIAVNYLRSAYARRRRREARIETGDGEMPDLRSTDPEKGALADSERAAVRQAVESLPANLREPVVLYYFEELNVEEIASILGIGEENVKSRLFRARRKLRQILGGDATPTPESG